MENGKAYLIGSMTEYLNKNEFHKATEWRKEATSFLNCNNIKVFDPTRNFNKNNNYCPSGIPMQNLYYIKKCGFALANLEYILKSPGSIFELSSFFVLQKPIIAYGQLTNYSHIDDILTMHFDTLQESLEYISNMYGQ